MRTLPIFRTLARAFTCGLPLIATHALGAQATAGRVFNPRVNSANPDYVAFETLTGDRQELTIRRLSTGATFPATTAATAASNGLVGLPGLASSSQVSIFSGDADWMPVLRDGQSWFAYVASVQGSVKLYINAVDASGNLVFPEPLLLPTQGSARHPRWSPDGKHLAFVSDSSILHIFWNLDARISSRTTARVAPSRIGAAGTGVLFPAWSPRGTAIAYQSALSDRGARRFGVEVLAIDTTLSSVRGAPILLTDDLIDGSAMRPSWSPDGKFVAYYVDRPVGPRDAQSALDIGIAEVQTQPTTGRILRGELLRGQSRRLAEGVLANSSRGPSWTRMYVGSEPRAALVYVQRDDAQGNPIFVHSLDAWTGMRDVNQSRVRLSSAMRTVNHREVSATESDGFVRYGFASVAEGGELLGTYDDSTAKWANGPAPLRQVVTVAQAAPLTAPSSVPVAPVPAALAPNVITTPSAAAARYADAPNADRGFSSSSSAGSSYVATARPGTSLGLAVLFPGAAQLAAGRTRSALALGAAGVIGGTLFVYGTTGTRYAGGLQQSAPTPSARADAKADFASKRQMQLMGFGTAGIAWFVGVVDAAMHRGSR